MSYKANKKSSRNDQRSLLPEVVSTQDKEFKITAICLTDQHAFTGRKRGQLHSLHPDITKIIRQLNGHTDRICCIVFCTQLDRVISGSLDNTARVWNVDTSECVHVLKGHTDGVRWAAVNETILITGSDDRTLRVWNIQSGDCLNILNENVPVFTCVNSVAFDGQRLARACWDNTVHVWTAPFMDECKGYVLKGHAYGIKRVWLCAHPNEHILISGGYNRVRVQNMNTGEWVCKPIEYEHVTVAGDRMIICTNNSPSIQIHQVHNGQLVHTIIDSTVDSLITCMSPVPDQSQLIVTGSYNGDVHLWDVVVGRSSESSINHSLNSWQVYTLAKSLQLKDVWTKLSPHRRGSCAFTTNT